MDYYEIRQSVADAGKDLLEKDLVARTWGNISARVDSVTCVITPSGLDYNKIEAEDIVSLNILTGEYDGLHKPSGEKGIHRAAYKIFPDVNFVIHTHQVYATALGLAGFEELKITEEERDFLGGISVAEYGLPGMKKLTDNVEAEMMKGSKIILMAHHGALILAESRKEAFDKAVLLEKICKRSVRGRVDAQPIVIKPFSDALMSVIRKRFPLALLVQSPHVAACANKENIIKAQLDDMAQMIGEKIPLVEKQAAKIIMEMEKRNAIMVSGMGVIVNGIDEDDTKALRLLVEKAAMCKIHTALCRRDAKLSSVDIALMHQVYNMKYSKMKTEA